MEGAGCGLACPAAVGVDSVPSVPAAAEVPMVSQPCGTHVSQVGGALAGMEGDGWLRLCGNFNSPNRSKSGCGAVRRCYILHIWFVSKRGP